MERLILTVPGMWADHHVLAIRDVLGAMPGVASVDASSMEKRVTLDYDPAATNADTISKGLEAAGYAPGEIPSPGAAPRKKPEWAVAAIRITVTNMADLAMSGDFRKY